MLHTSFSLQHDPDECNIGDIDRRTFHPTSTTPTTLPTPTDVVASIEARHATPPRRYFSPDNYSCRSIHRPGRQGSCRRGSMDPSCECRRASPRLGAGWVRGGRPCITEGVSHGRGEDPPKPLPAALSGSPMGRRHEKCDGGGKHRIHRRRGEKEKIR